MRILITGSKGQLGNELVRCIGERKAEIGPIPAEYSGAHVDAVDYDSLDISKRDAVDDWFDSNEYDLVINCAAITNVNGCEIDEDGAFRVNALGPENLARACAVQGAKMVQVSTDYVFSGNKAGERVEGDETGPISAYGRTKLAGEKKALALNPKTFVCRTAWLYGYVGNNFVKTMRRLGATHDEVAVVDDQLGNPTSANDLAYEILKVAISDDYGIYHITNNGTCSWARFAQAIMDGSALACHVVPVTSEQYKKANPSSADRPHYSGLCNCHLEATVGDEMRSWEDALSDYLRRLPELEERANV